MSEQASVSESMGSAREWEMCVEDELRELQDRVGERVKRRVMANIRRAGILEALLMPYRRDLVTAEVNYEARKAVRDMRRHLASELRDRATRGGFTPGAGGPYLESGKNVSVLRRGTTLIIALLLDVIALHFLLEPGGELLDIGKQMVSKMGSDMGDGIGDVTGRVQYLWQTVRFTVALVKIGVPLWFVSKLHKMLVRGDVEVQIWQAVEQLVKSLHDQLAGVMSRDFFTVHPISRLSLMKRLLVIIVLVPIAACLLRQDLQRIQLSWNDPGECPACMGSGKGKGLFDWGACDACKGTGRAHK